MVLKGEGIVRAQAELEGVGTLLVQIKMWRTNIKILFRIKGYEKL